MKFWLVAGAISGFLSVALGAFAAHGLQSRVGPAEIAVFETGARYQMYHALALLAVAWVAMQGGGIWTTVAGWAFIIGTILFSGTLYYLGITGSRIETIRRLAQAVCSGSLVFDGARDPDELCRALTAIKGIGDWTAQYVVMRALKHPDAFPGSDLGLLQALGLKGAPGIKTLQRRAEAWRPWRAYAALLLWSSLANSGG